MLFQIVQFSLWETKDGIWSQWGGFGAIDIYYIDK